LNAQSGVDVQNEDDLQKNSCGYISCSDNGTNVELLSRESQESERVAHPERNISSNRDYQNHPCGPATIEDKKKKLTFRDKIGL
jgi:hypothetical protein